MQYTQLKQVIELDDKITSLHQQLSNLYAKRALFVGTSGLEDFGPSRAATVRSQIAAPLQDPWVIQTYSYLVSAWLIHDIAIPTITELDKKLLKAQKIIQNITGEDPKLGAQMGVLLVPPSSLLSFPVSDKTRHRQKHVLLSDYINSDLFLAGKTRKKSWQILVTPLSLIGVNYGTAAIIIKYKKYLVAGYDTRALGLRQYAALSLQINQAIDQNVWTVLLGETTANSDLIPSATFLNGQYRFELDESNSILGEERFRPAVEVAG